MNPNTIPLPNLSDPVTSLQVLGINDIDAFFKHPKQQCDMLSEALLENMEKNNWLTALKPHYEMLEKRLETPKGYWELEDAKGPVHEPEVKTQTIDPVYVTDDAIRDSIEDILEDEQTALYGRYGVLQEFISDAWETTITRADEENRDVTLEALFEATRTGSKLPDAEALAFTRQYMAHYLAGKTLNAFPKDSADISGFMEFNQIRHPAQAADILVQSASIYLADVVEKDPKPFMQLQSAALSETDSHEPAHILVSGYFAHHNAHYGLHERSMTNMAHQMQRTLMAENKMFLAQKLQQETKSQLDDAVSALDEKDREISELKEQLAARIGKRTSDFPEIQQDQYPSREHYDTAISNARIQRDVVGKTGNHTAEKPPGLNRKAGWQAHIVSNADMPKTRQGNVKS